MNECYATDLKLTDVIMIRNMPCKIIGKRYASMGKHGNQKIMLIGIGLFDDKKYEDIVIQQLIILPIITTDCLDVVKFNIFRLDVSNVTNISGMFNNNKHDTIELYDINTDNIIEYTLNYKFDKDKELLNYINSNNNIYVTVIRYLTLIRIIDIEIDIIFK
jgi:translation elongation factor P/translation initiation factor 5A